MEDVFAEAHRRAGSRGAGPVLRLWLREVVDIGATALRLRTGWRRVGAEGGGAARRRAGRDTNGGGGVMGLADDFRYSVRSLVRRPSVTVFAALTLALGVGATTAMFSTLEAVVLNPLPFENGDRMAGLFRQVGNARVFLSPRAEDIAAWSAHEDLFEAVEPWSFRPMTLTGLGEARELRVAMVRPSFFELLGREPALGRAFAPEELIGQGARVVMLGDGFWRRELGGSPDAIGASLVLDGEAWTVIGVMPSRTPIPGWGLRPVDLWRPLPSANPDDTAQALALLREGVDVGAVNERLAVAGASSDGIGSIGIANLVRDQVAAGIRDHLVLLMGAVVLLLLISCVNVANLLIFRADTRRRETAVRSALGGGRWRLARQLLVESLLLAGIGGALGVVVSYFGQIGILELRPSQLEVLDQVAINGRVLLFALAVTMGTGVLFGLFPALQAGRSDALAPLRSGVRCEGNVVGGRVRWLLVSGEVALSFALLLGSLSVLATLVARQRADLGYEGDQVLVMDVNAPEWRHGDEQERERLFDDIRARVSMLPGIAAASRASAMPPNAGILFGNLQVEGGEPSEETTVLHGPLVDTAYFATLGQAVVRGRSFTAEDLRSEEPLIMIGETTARTFFADREPVGARFRVGDGDRWYTVIGVAADVPMTGLSAATAPQQVYHPLRESWTGAAFLARVEQGADREATLSLMAQAARAIDPDLRIDRLAVADELMRETLDRERFATTIMATFAAFALVLASIGLYGVVSQVVGQRTKEIGIRIALGAGRSSIAGMVLGRAGGATLAGVAVGVVMAASGIRVLGSRIHGLEATSVGTYALAAAALGLTALLAAYAPARRATSVDPVDAMRVD